MKNIFPKINPWIGAILIFLIVLLIVSTFFFIRGSVQFHKGGGMHLRNPLTIFSSGARHPTGNPVIQDVESIEGWMTFTYINLTFHLPENLLRDTLSIDSVKYPKISLESYARAKKLDKTTFLNQVKDAVRKTLSEKPTP